MTQVISPANAEIKDFSFRKQVQFRIDDEIFNGVPNMPADSLLEFVTKFAAVEEGDDLSMAQQKQMFSDMINLVLDDASATRFIERMGSKAEPISLPQVMDIIPWLMEQYGMRPTQPSSDSSSGSANQESGTSSMAGASPAELTSSVSQLRGS